MLQGVYAPAGVKRWLLEAADHERLVSAAARVFQTEPAVLAVYLYGSAARGEPAVDLDVAVLLEERLPPRRLEELASGLQALGAPGGPSIDLRPLSGAAPRFQVNVIKEARVLFEADRTKRLRREAEIAGRWADFRPIWERMRHRMRRRWLSG
jgi:predicted nucleotidyltransferase